MPSDWTSPCGVAYRSYEDGRFEVQDQGFPAYDLNGGVAGEIRKLWAKWGPYLQQGATKSNVPAAWLVGILYAESGGKTGSTAACSAALCPAIWKAGGCASQGGSNSVCAGGLMGFIASTAQMYGRTIDWYMQDDDHEGQMIVDAADLLVQKIRAAKGCVLCAIKSYNGGSACKDTGLAKGPGIVGMYGQADYVEKILRVANTFVALQLPGAPAVSGSAGMSSGQGAVVAVVLGAVAFMLADIRWGLVSRLERALQR